MGTRAMISIDGEPYIATHWDGYPTSLGADLYAAKTEDAIQAVATAHSVNYARPSIVAKLQARQSGYLVEDIARYGDFAEYQYDFNSKTKRWRYRWVRHAWPEKEVGEWGNLTKKAIKQESTIGG